MPQTPPNAPPLRLLASDVEDLTVLAAALRDAVGRIGDIIYEPFGRRLTLSVDRFRWELEGGAALRVRSAVQFGSVLKVSRRRLRQDDPDAVVSLMTIDFVPGEPPGGAVCFIFSGGEDLKLDVECIDAVMSDLEDVWSVQRATRQDET